MQAGNRMNLYVNTYIKLYDVWTQCTFAPLLMKDYGIYFPFGLIAVFILSFILSNLVLYNEVSYIFSFL